MTILSSKFRKASCVLFSQNTVCDILELLELATLRYLSLYKAKNKANSLFSLF